MTDRAIKHQGFDLALHPDDDGLLEVDWGSHVTTERLADLVHLDMFNALFGKWRRVRWSESGRVTGVELRAHPAGRRAASAEPEVTNARQATSERERAALDALRPKLLREYRRTGKLMKPLKALIQGTPLQGRDTKTIYAWLASPRYPYFDEAWFRQYKAAQEEKPWAKRKAA